MFGDAEVAGRGRGTDRGALVIVKHQDSGRVRLTIEATGSQGGRRREWVTLSDAGRRELIVFLGGVPTEETQAKGSQVGGSS